MARKVNAATDPRAKRGKAKAEPKRCSAKRAGAPQSTPFKFDDDSTPMSLKAIGTHNASLMAQASAAKQEEAGSHSDEEAEEIDAPTNEATHGTPLAGAGHGGTSGAMNFLLSLRRDARGSGHSAYASARCREPCLPVCPPPILPVVSKAGIGIPLVQLESPGSQAPSPGQVCEDSSDNDDAQMQHVSSELTEVFLHGLTAHLSVMISDANHAAAEEAHEAHEPLDAAEEVRRNLPFQRLHSSQNRRIMRFMTCSHLTPSPWLQRVQSVLPWLQRCVLSNLGTTQPRRM